MKYVNIENTLVLNLLTIDALQHLFINLGKLDKGSFDIVQMKFADGSSITAFVYPTDFNNAKAYSLIEKIATETLNLSVQELARHCSG
jgi:hypothetical protein